MSGELDHNGAIQTQAVCDYFPFSVPHPELDTWQILDQVTDGEAQLWEIQRELSQLQAEEEILYRPFQTLSKGEQTKALLAALSLRQGHFLLIDEPTNHLDMKTKDILKQALVDFDGTLIVVSHDRDFLDGLVTKVYEFGNQRVKEHLCGIYEFLETKKMENLQELERKNDLKSPFFREKTGI